MGDIKDLPLHLLRLFPDAEALFFQNFYEEQGWGDYDGVFVGVAEVRRAFERFVEIAANLSPGKYLTIGHLVAADGAEQLVGGAPEVILPDLRMVKSYALETLGLAYLAGARFWNGVRKLPPIRGGGYGVAAVWTSGGTGDDMHLLSLDSARPLEVSPQFHLPAWETLSGVLLYTFARERLADTAEVLKWEDAQSMRSADDAPSQGTEAVQSTLSGTDGGDFEDAEEPVTPPLPVIQSAEMGVQTPPHPGRSTTSSQTPPHPTTSSAAVQVRIVGGGPIGTTPALVKAGGQAGGVVGAGIGGALGSAIAGPTGASLGQHAGEMAGARIGEVIAGQAVSRLPAYPHLQIPAMQVGGSSSSSGPAYLPQAGLPWGVTTSVTVDGTHASAQQHLAGPWDTEENPEAYLGDGPWSADADWVLDLEAPEIQALLVQCTGGTAEKISSRTPGQESSTS
jgi:hypothetical protein